MKITIENIKALRNKTKAGYFNCKEALLNSSSMEEAEKFLTKKGLKIIDSGLDNNGSNGIIKVYTHPGDRICALVEVSCDTDFVAKTPEFHGFAKEVAMQVASMKPKYISRQEISLEDLAQEVFFRKERLKREGKDDLEIEKLLPNEIEQWFTECCLLEQTYIRDNKKLIKDLLADLISKTQENCKVRRFSRWEVGTMEPQKKCEEEPYNSGIFSRMPHLKTLALIIIILTTIFLFGAIL